MKLIFGFPIHENFQAAIDLYKTIKYYCGDHQVLFSSNENLGENYENLKKFKAKRDYRWGHSHNFIIDVAEYLKFENFDYFIKIDSDCLFANYGLEKLIKEEECDFTLEKYKDQNNWIHGWIFQKHINEYLKILLESLGIKRKNDQIVGTMNAFSIFSKQAINYINGFTSHLENIREYTELMMIPQLCLDELILYNILKDSNLKYRVGNRGKEFSLINGVRYRPYWSIDELNDEKEILYHPVLRSSNDKFRKRILTGVTH